MTRGTSGVGHDERVTHFDLAVIGTGSGNTIVDRRFTDRKVAIIERGPFGGTCLNVGCIPTKMFVWPADIAHYLADAHRLGLDGHFERVRWRDMRDRIFGRIDPIAADGRAYRAERQSHVTVYDGHAAFDGPRSLVVRLHSGEERGITADQVVLALGSRVRLPDIEGLSSVPFHTSDTVMRIDDLPRHIGIIGGGFVAAEFAHVFGALGSEVTLVHRGPRLLQMEDEAVSARFTEVAARSWDVRLETVVTRVEPVGSGVRMLLSSGAAVEVDVLLIATGRQPNTDGIGLERAGVEVDADGAVVTDDFLRTTADGVWALGDVVATPMLKHVANHEARVVRHNLLHPDSLRPHTGMPVPAAVFTHPQVASVGRTEQDLRAAGASYVWATSAYAGIAYGWAMEDTTGFCKVLADPATGLLLGGHVIGPQASAVIQPLVQMMSLGNRVSEVARGQYWIHPALPEVVENALLGLRLHS